MVLNRRTAAHYLLPIGAAALALALHLGLRPAEHAALPIRVLLGTLVIVLVFATVFAVLHHAEGVAHRVGEPYGTLVLTGAVTAIEVSVIVSMMLHGGNNPDLARESVFSTVMIGCGGIVGICLTVGSLRHHYQDIKRQGTNSFLAVLIALTVLTLVLPNFTIATGPGTFSTGQLAFVSILSILLYGSFVFAQMAQYRGDFVEDLVAESAHADHVPTEGIAWNAVLLFVGLAGIVFLTEQIAADVEDGMAALQIAQSDAITGAFIATLVMMPEAGAAIRAALKNELQRSINIALGSACATIGLTIPAVAAASLITGKGLILGLSSGDTVLLLLVLSISIVSFGTGRTTVLTGLVHLVVFFTYLLLIVTP